MNSFEYSWDNPCSNAYQCSWSSTVPHELELSSSSMEWSSSVPRELELSSSSMESSHGRTDPPENLFATAMIDSWSDSEYTRVDEMLEELIPSLDDIDSVIPKKNWLISSLNQEDIRLAPDQPSAIAGATRPVIGSPEFGLSPVGPGMLNTFFSQEGSNIVHICPPVNDLHFFENCKPSPPSANGSHFFADPAKSKKLLKQETISFRNSSNSPASSSGEPDVEAIAQMKEMMYRAAAFRPVNFGAEDELVAARRRRKNVRISSDPQTVAARQRRERISERIRVLQRLVPGGNKMDTASMLEEAANYLKYLRSQVSAMEKMGKKVEGDVRSPVAAFNYDHTSQAAMQAARLLPHDHHHYYSFSD